jgi:hypothetical protein
MAESVDAIWAFHHAFRNDLERIDTAAYNSAKGKEGLSGTIERYRFFNEMLVWHAKGEEVAVFPVVETVAPLVAEAYVLDHHGLDAAYAELNASYAARDLLKTARATAAFRFHLAMHLGKEDAHLYRIFREKIPLPEQVKALGVMSGMIPQDRFAEVVMWLYPLINMDDRENMTLIWQMMMPVPLFAGAKQLIRRAIGNEWAELVRRIPGLEPK